MTHQQFITKDKKHIPINNGRTTGLTSKSLGVTPLSVAEIKKINAPNGTFTGFNVKSKRNETVRLTKVGKMKNGTFMLKGTSPTNDITVVRIVSGKKQQS